MIPLPGDAVEFRAVRRAAGGVPLWDLSYTACMDPRVPTADHGLGVLPQGARVMVLHVDRSGGIGAGWEKMSWLVAVPGRARLAWIHGMDVSENGDGT